MRVPLLAAALALAAAAQPQAQPKQPRTPPSWNEGDTNIPEGLQYRTFASAHAKTDVSYYIYLPPGYDSSPDRRYPVVYWLHGIGGNTRVGAAFSQHMDAAIRANTAPPLIAVFVNGMRDSWYIDTADGARPVESVIIQDLIPHVDKTYRTIADRKGRAVEGFSMGGFGAAHLGFKYPEYFGVVGIMAGAMLPATRAGQFKAFGEDQSFFDANSPRVLIEKNAGKIRGRTRIRLFVGDEDKAVNQGPKTYHEWMESLKIPHDWGLLPGVGHDIRKIYEVLGDRTEAFYRDAFAGVAAK